MKIHRADLTLKRPIETYFADSFIDSLILHCMSTVKTRVRSHITAATTLPGLLLPTNSLPTTASVLPYLHVLRLDTDKKSSSYFLSVLWTPTEPCLQAHPAFLSSQDVLRQDALVRLHVAVEAPAHQLVDAGRREAARLGHLRHDVLLLQRLPRLQVPAGYYRLPELQEGERAEWVRGRNGWEGEYAMRGWQRVKIERGWDWRSEWIITPIMPNSSLRFWMKVRIYLHLKKNT